MILKILNCKDGEVVKIDIVDHAAIKNYKWRILRQVRDGYTKKYVVSHIYENKDWTKPKTIYLHRLIMLPDNDLVIDHINGDGLDNRRKNLRIVTKSQNAYNRNFGRSAFNHSQY
jgi:hypothetical protein